MLIAAAVLVMFTACFADHLHKPTVGQADQRQKYEFCEDYESVEI